MGRQIEEEQVERVVGLPPCLVRRRHTEPSSIINLLGYKMSSPSSPLLLRLLLLFPLNWFFLSDFVSVLLMFMCLQLVMENTKTHFLLMPLRPSGREEERKQGKVERKGVDAEGLITWRSQHSTGPYGGRQMCRFKDNNKWT